MVIDGISQSPGVERLIDLSSAEAGVLLVISDRAGAQEWVRLVLPAEELIAILTDHPEGPQAVVGMSGDEARELKVEVRRNEVLLAVGESDAAVGLDDLMDALASVLPAA